MGVGLNLTLPGGGTSLQLLEVMARPAAVLLEAGETPPPAVPGERPELDSIRVLDLVEAQSILQQETETRRLPKVPFNASEKMRTRHHAIARLMAAGVKQVDVCRAIGTTPQSLKTLEGSPAFQALLLEYMNMMDKAAIDTATKLRVLNSMGVDELTHRLSDPVEAGKLKTTEVLEIVKVASDRTGLGPTSSKTVSLNGRISIADIRAMKDAQSILEAESAEWVDVSDAGGDSSILEAGEDEPAAEAGAGVGTGRGSTLGTQDDLSDLIPSLDALFR